MAEETVKDEAVQGEEPVSEDSAAEAAPAPPAQTVELLEDEIRSVGAERDEYKDALIRERADFENYKKRNAALEQTALERGTEAAVVRLLPVMDSFERALAADTADVQFAAGMEMIMRQLRDVLKGLGVEEIDSSGAFDPSVHHAVMQTEEADVPSNQIVETLQKGYRMGDKVIRAAMVKVNK